MKTNYLFALNICACMLLYTRVSVQTAPPPKQWTYHYWGSDVDEAFFIKLTTDGESVVATVNDLRPFANYSSNPADPDRLINDVTALILRYPLFVNSKNYVERRFLLNNTTDNTVWTNAWNTNSNVVINPALQKMFKLLLNLPEFHL